MAEIVGGQVGPEAKYALKFEGGYLKAMVEYTGADLGADVAVKFGAEKFITALIDALEGAIPGDQTLFAETLKVAVKQAMK